MLEAFFVRLSIKNASIRALSSGTTRNYLSSKLAYQPAEIYNNLPGTTSSIVNGARLNGSFESDNRCDFIVARSRMVLDDGKQTGSRITVNINGSCGKEIIKSIHREIEKGTENPYPRTRLEVLQGLPLLSTPPSLSRPCLRRLAAVQSQSHSL